MNTNVNNWSDDNIFQAWNGSRRLDDKGREIGYIVGMNDSLDGKQFAAWVQKGRRDIKTGEFFEFGPHQRAKYFETKQEAKAWAYATCRERLAAVS